MAKDIEQCSASAQNLDTIVSFLLFLEFKEVPSNMHEAVVKLLLMFSSLINICIRFSPGYLEVLLINVSNRTHDKLDAKSIKFNILLLGYPTSRKGHKFILLGGLVNTSFL